MGSSERGDRSVYLGKLIDWEERWRGEKGRKLVEGAGARSGIDHVTTPAITSDMPVCFYCTVMPNEIVSCKNTGEKHDVLDGGGKPRGQIVTILFTH